MKKDDYTPKSIRLAKKYAYFCATQTPLEMLTQTYGPIYFGGPKRRASCRRHPGKLVLVWQRPGQKVYSCPECTSAWKDRMAQRRGTYFGPAVVMDDLCAL